MSNRLSFEAIIGDKKKRGQREQEGDDDGIGSTKCDGASSMSMANALSLFAPPSYRDVANELDLLDFVDENEKYEIVRSFAMQHIVPYMRGPSSQKAQEKKDSSTQSTCDS